MITGVNLWNIYAPKNRTEIPEAKTNGTEKADHTYYWRFQNFILSNW